MLIYLTIRLIRLYLLSHLAIRCICNVLQTTSSISFQAVNFMFMKLGTYFFVVRFNLVSCYNFEMDPSDYLDT